MLWQKRQLRFIYLLFTVVHHTLSDRAVCVCVCVTGGLNLREKNDLILYIFKKGENDRER